MAWEISIASEGWAEIQEQLESWSSRALVQAICDDEIEAQGLCFVEEMEAYEISRRPALRRLPHDVLVNLAFDLIVQNNTCDNGGHAFWIDRQGCHRVGLAG